MQLSINRVELMVYVHTHSFSKSVQISVIMRSISVSNCHMQMKRDSPIRVDPIFPGSQIYSTPTRTVRGQEKTGGDLLNFLKSATLDSVKQETCEKPEKRRKRVVHPSKHILRNMNEEGLDCGAYTKRRVGRKPRPNVIPDEIMKCEDYFDPLVEALFTDASKIERFPEDTFRTPEKDGMGCFLPPTRLRGRPPKRKATNDIPVERLVSLQANFSYNYNFNNNNNNNNNNNSNNNNSNNNNNNNSIQYTLNNSQQCFSDPALANILQDELQFLPTTIEELYTNTLQTNTLTPSNMSMNSLMLHPPNSPKKLRPASVRPTPKSCRRKIDLSMEPAFQPDDFLIPPPSKRICEDIPVPPLPAVNSISYPYPATDLIPSPVDPIPLDSWASLYPTSIPYTYYSNSSTDSSYSHWSEVTLQTNFSTSTAPTVEAPYDPELDQMLDLLGREQSQPPYYINNGILVE